MVKGKKNGLKRLRTVQSKSADFCRLLLPRLFTAILKIGLPQCNAIGVRTPPDVIVILLKISLG